MQASDMLATVRECSTAEEIPEQQQERDSNFFEEAKTPRFAAIGFWATPRVTNLLMKMAMETGMPLGLEQMVKLSAASKQEQEKEGCTVLKMR